MDGWMVLAYKMLGSSNRSLIISCVSVIVTRVISLYAHSVLQHYQFFIPATICLAGLQSATGSMSDLWVISLNPSGAT